MPARWTRKAALQRNCRCSRILWANIACSPAPTSLGKRACERPQRSSQPGPRSSWRRPATSASAGGRQRDRAFGPAVGGAPLRHPEAGAQHGDARRRGGGVGKELDGSSGAGGVQTFEGRQASRPPGASCPRRGRRRPGPGRTAPAPSSLRSPRRAAATRGPGACATSNRRWRAGWRARRGAGRGSGGGGATPAGAGRGRSRS